MAEPTDEELTRFLAEKVMGWTLVEIPDWEHSGHSPYWIDGDGNTYSGSWSPVTDANDTLMVIEAARNKGWQVETVVGPYDDEDNRWVAELVRYRGYKADGFASESADTFQRTVCLTAYKAIKEADND